MTFLTAVVRMVETSNLCHFVIFVLPFLLTVARQQVDDLRPVLIFQSL